MIEKTITAKNSRTGTVQDRGRAHIGPNSNNIEENGIVGMGKIPTVGQKP
jgi:hypothetical protein